MQHNTLYRFQRGQKNTLRFLGILFLFLAIIWWIAEIVEWGFPMEPPVVFIGGLTTFLLIYWPFTPTYSHRRKKGRNSFNYSTNNGNFTIGVGETQFTLCLSKASDTLIHFYDSAEDILEVGISETAGKISEVKDVAEFDFSNRAVRPKEGQIVCVKNKYGNYACVHIVDVKDASRTDDRDEVTFSYVINPDGGKDFS